MSDPVADTMSKIAELYVELEKLEASKRIPNLPSDEVRRIKSQLEGLHRFLKGSL